MSETFLIFFISAKRTLRKMYNAHTYKTNKHAGTHYTQMHLSVQNRRTMDYETKTLNVKLYISS